MRLTVRSWSLPHAAQSQRFTPAVSSSPSTSPPTMFGESRQYPLHDAVDPGREPISQPVSLNGVRVFWPYGHPTAWESPDILRRTRAFFADGNGHGVLVDVQTHIAYRTLHGPASRCSSSLRTVGSRPRSRSVTYVAVSAGPTMMTIENLCGKRACPVRVLHITLDVHRFLDKKDATCQSLRQVLSCLTFCLVAGSLGHPRHA